MAICEDIPAPDLTVERLLSIKMKFTKPVKGYGEFCKQYHTSRGCVPSVMAYAKRIITRDYAGIGEKEVFSSIAQYKQSITDAMGKLADVELKARASCFGAADYGCSPQEVALVCDFCLAFSRASNEIIYKLL